MEKEWFNGFVANGLQFRLDGYKINLQGITYHICVKNISGREIEIEKRFIFALTASGYSREMRPDKLIAKDMNWLGRRYGIMIGCVICTHKNVLLMGVIKLC